MRELESLKSKGVSLMKCKIVQGEIKQSSRLWGDYDHHFSCTIIFIQSRNLYRKYIFIACDSKLRVAGAFYPIY